MNYCITLRRDPTGPGKGRGGRSQSGGHEPARTPSSEPGSHPGRHHAGADLRGASRDVKEPAPWQGDSVPEPAPGPGHEARVEGSLWRGLYHPLTWSLLAAAGPGSPAVPQDPGWVRIPVPVAEMGCPSLADQIIAWLRRSRTVTGIDPRTRSTTGAPLRPPPTPGSALPRAEQPSDAVIHLPCGGEKGDELLHHSQEGFSGTGQVRRAESRWRA